MYIYLKFSFIFECAIFFTIVPFFAGYTSPATYDYTALAMQSSAANASLHQQYFYPQMFDPTQYMAAAGMPGIQGKSISTCDKINHD